MLELTLATKIYVCAIAFLLGSCMGSFVNCAADRYVCKQSVLRGRSHCPACGRTLGFVDLIPIFSYIFLRGKCRRCGAKIPVSCLITEIIGGVGYLLIPLVLGFSLLALELALLAPALLAVALIDLKTMEIPNGLVLYIAVLFVPSVPMHFYAGAGPTLLDGVIENGMLRYFLDGLMGSVAVGGGLLLLSLVMDRILKRESLGGGDIKLFFAVGLFLGLWRSLLMVILACIFGLATALVFRLKNKSKAPELTDVGKTPQGDIARTQEIDLSSPASNGDATSASDSNAAASSGVESSQTDEASEQTSSGTTPSVEEGGEQTQNRQFPFGPAICLATFVSMLVGTYVINIYLSLFL